MVMLSLRKTPRRIGRLLGVIGQFMARQVKIDLLED